MTTQTELCKYGQEPKSCTSSPMDCQCVIDAALAQPEQECVACTECKRLEDELEHANIKATVWKSAYDVERGYNEQDTTPPQRTWVGLTDEDLAVCGDEDDVMLARYWERVLKEKNT